MVLVYSDDKKLTLELLNKGKELAKELHKKVIAVCIGHDSFAKDYLEHGADSVIAAEADLHTFKAEEYASILEKIVKENNVEVVLIGSNKNGKELAARLSAKLDTGCVTDCTNVYVKDKKIVTERMVYSGNAIAVEQFLSHPQIVTIPPKAFNPLPKTEGHKGEVIKKKYDFERSPSKITKVQEMKTEGVNVEDAEIIVSCGRGFKNKDDIRLVRELADALKGRTIGCSRPIAADLKWLSEDHWIGLSGHKVKPKLYIACGISGQIQHIAGMRDSGVVVAINKDPEALIFKSADYGIVGDLYQVLPKLTNAIREKMG
ncbi:MAG: electron transfer flavoprotein subunit alpha/FixB family protein [Candidatus Thermoplasmatota archaeon]|jgi:electron transfer flavoprotein alpha subunit|nr:electron transfer flavoprotein subunit alpha/FixB family protein [Candidatus Thermoplasmatota archaeon]